MTTWTAEELDQIGSADELRVASLREDGQRSSWRTIWVVRDGDDIYIRSAYGPGSAWFCSTRTRHEGRIRANDVERDVTFVDAEPASNDAVTAAYRSKYHRYDRSIVDMMVSDTAASTTLRLLPR